MRNTSEPSQKVTKLARPVVQVDPELYRKFQEACAAQDLTVSQVLRRFMRESVEEREAEAAA